MSRAIAEHRRGYLRDTELYKKRWLNSILEGLKNPRRHR